MAKITDSLTDFKSALKRSAAQVHKNSNVLVGKKKSGIVEVKKNDQLMESLPMKNPENDNLSEGEIIGVCFTYSQPAKKKEKLDKSEMFLQLTELSTFERNRCLIKQETISVLCKTKNSICPLKIDSS